MTFLPFALVHTTKKVNNLHVTSTISGIIDSLINNIHDRLDCMKLIIRLETQFVKLKS